MTPLITVLLLLLNHTVQQWYYFYFEGQRTPAADVSYVLYGAYHQMVANVIIYTNIKHILSVISTDFKVEKTD